MATRTRRASGTPPDSTACGVPPDWKAIESEVPDLVVHTVMRLGEGWTAEAYRVNSELVFKFPKRSGEWEELDHEIAFLAHARQFLPVPVVEHLHQIRQSRGAPHGYAVYRFLPGAPLALGARLRSRRSFRASAWQALSDAAQNDLAAQMAGFLRILHHLHSRPQLAAVLRHEDERVTAEQYFHDAMENVTPTLTDAECRRLRSIFERHLEDPENFGSMPHVIHADLSADHLLYADGRITGILDWGDVCLGDPDYDFSCLWGIDERFARDVAQRYGHPDLGRLSRKAHYFQVVEQVDTIVHGSGYALPGQEAAAWQQLRALLH